MENEKKNFWKRNSIVFKALIIFILILILLIPKAMIKGLIKERESRQIEAIQEVSSKWGGKQTISGPIISIPFYEYYKSEKGRLEKYIDHIHFLPEKLDIKGDVFPERRYRGIYEVVVYSTKLTIEGEFTSLDFKGLNIPEKDILFDDAFLSIGLSDLRGIEEDIRIKWNEKTCTFNSGIPCDDILYSGINTRIDIYKPDTNVNYKFKFDVELKGSEKLFFTPIGKVTDVNISSKWNDPGFDGKFLPDHREIEQDSFSARWKILHVNRNFPQKWIGDKYKIESSAFGVNLLLPVDSYQKSMRSVKYAIMFIGLTFIVFFFIEIKHKKPLHPFQYLLVGLALCVFYVLLISVSEHTNFNLAYLIACVPTIALIALYAKGILKSNRYSLITTALLTLLYGFLFIIIQLQDYALLMGSIGLFVILAVIMFFSRKIDWFDVNIKKESTNDDNPDIQS